MNLTQAIDLFLKRKQVTCSTETLQNYSSGLRLFSAWLASVGVSDLDALSEKHFFDYLDSLRSRNQFRRAGKLTTITIHKRMKLTKSFLLWLAGQGLIAYALVSKFPIPKAGKRLPKALSPEQVKVLWAVPMSARDKSILALFLDSGLRVTELVNLVLLDLDLGRGVVHVAQGKGDKERYALFGQFTAEYLRVWLAERESSSDLVFVDKWGQGLTDSGVYKIIRRIAQQAGVKVHPHVLRHTFATQYLDAGGQVTDLQFLMGHTEIQTTMIYLSVSLERVRSQFAGRSLVNSIEGKKESSA